MHRVNKEARDFLKDNYVTVRNEFSNEGLIEYKLGNLVHRNSLKELELHIEKVIKRNNDNRNLTISVASSDILDCIKFLENSSSAKSLKTCYLKISKF